VKIYFQRLRGLSETREFDTIDAFYRYLDTLTKANRADPYKRKQFWKAMDPDTREVLATWEPGQLKWRVERSPGGETPLW
jgi:hypothetical protein